MKKLVFLIMLAFTGLSIKVCAQHIADGQAGTLTWSIDVQGNDTVFTINGNDTMPDYYDWSGGTPWDAYKGIITTVVIGDSVTTIGRSAFKDCINLTSVNIPISITNIGANAFQQCVKLPSVTIPDSVITIGSSAFRDCMSLNSVIIGNSVTSIGMWAFALCTNLTAVTIPNNVTSIEGSAFLLCYNLMDVVLSNRMTSIEDATFGSCNSLISITIPNSVTTIYGNAFGNCYSLASIVIGNNVTTIYQWAFNNCNGLRSITIHTITPPKVLYNNVNQVFQNVQDTIPIYIPCGTYNEYRTASGWDYFSNFIDPSTKDTSFYSASFPQGETYNDNNFTGLTETGRYCVTLQNSNDCDSVVCLDLMYDYTNIEEITNYKLQITYYEVYDILGRKHLTRHCGLDPQSTTNKTWQEIAEQVRNDIPRGTYILKLNTNQGIITKKIINF